MRKTLTTAAAAAAVALVLTACGGGTDSGNDDGSTASGGGGSTTIKVAYQKTDAFTQLDDLLQKCVPEFEAEHEGVTVQLEPIAAQETEYFTKLALMHGSAATAPDVVYEDTFQVRSDAAAGYLAPMDDYLADWDGWDQFSDAAKQAGAGDDGSTYGVSMGTDTRGIYFNKEIFEQAGLAANWQPESWDDILEAARTIKEKVPDVIPFNLSSGRCTPRPRVRTGSSSSCARSRSSRSGLARPEPDAALDACVGRPVRAGFPVARPISGEARGAAQVWGCSGGWSA